MPTLIIRLIRKVRDSLPTLPKFVRRVSLKRQTKFSVSNVAGTAVLPKPSLFVSKITSTDTGMAEQGSLPKLQPETTLPTSAGNDFVAGPVGVVSVKDSNVGINGATVNFGTGATCPYCGSIDVVKRGTRKNKFQIVQLYICKNESCVKTFTAQDVKGKHFPLSIIIEGMSYYNLGCTLGQTCALLKKKYGIAPEPETLSGWVNEYKPLCRYERLRSYAVKMFKPTEAVELVTLAHRQLYRFRFHRAKTTLMLDEFKNHELSPLAEYLQNVSSETPHQYFAEGERMSEVRSKFDKTDLLIKPKTNFANKLASFVLKSVSDNKRRHEELQKFMIANDSVTVATEVPVYIRREDVEHMENQLHFSITDDGCITMKGDATPRKMPKVMTGHIDFVQIRNGSVYILDYKPKASKERPIEQLTWYALALSRLTGLRLFKFVCAWFDEENYYQFFPLHVVKKLSNKKKRRIKFKDGAVAELLKKDVFNMVKSVAS